MAETDTAAPASPYDALGVDDTKTKELTATMAANQRDKIAATDKITGDLEQVTDRTLPRLEMLSRTSGVEAEKMKPWNADEESAKRRTDPIEAFGSIGSVFGILASAFTHAPMENALNASAAAINSIKEGDSKAYDRAYKAWEDNTKRRLERHKIQHEAYQDAVSLLSTNMAVANTKLQVAAARFGDKQVLALLDAGMSKEVQDLLASRQKMSLELAENLPKITTANAEMARLFALGYDPKNPSSEKSQQAYQKYKQEQVDWKQAERAFTPEQQAYSQFVKEKPNATPEERASYIQDLRRRGNLTPEQEAVNAFLEQKPDATAEDLKAFVTDLRAKSRGATLGGNTHMTGERERQTEVLQYKEGLRVEKNEDGTPKYTNTQVAEMGEEFRRKLGTKAAVLPGGARVKIDTAINNITTAEKVLGDMENLLKKHKAITGFGGTVMRKAETLGNIFGAESADYHEFLALHSTLKRMLPGIITGSNATRFKQEISEMDNIVAGTKMGDLAPSVSENYKKLREIFSKIKPDLDRMRKGEEAPINPAPADAPGSKDQPWLRAPIKRSAAEMESDVG